MCCWQSLEGVDDDISDMDDKETGDILEISLKA